MHSLTFCVWNFLFCCCPRTDSCHDDDRGNSYASIVPIQDTKTNNPGCWMHSINIPEINSTIPFTITGIMDSVPSARLRCRRRRLVHFPLFSTTVYDSTDHNRRVGIMELGQFIWSCGELLRLISSSNKRIFFFPLFSCIHHPSTTEMELQKKTKSAHRLNSVEDTSVNDVSMTVLYEQW